MTNFGRDRLQKKLRKISYIINYITEIIEVYMVKDWSYKWSDFGSRNCQPKSKWKSLFCYFCFSEGINGKNEESKATQNQKTKNPSIMDYCKRRAGFWIMHPEGLLQWFSTLPSLPSKCMSTTEDSHYGGSLQREPPKWCCEIKWYTLTYLSWRVTINMSTINR